jgi:hypothetical protein
MPATRSWSVFSNDRMTDFIAVPIAVALGAVTWGLLWLLTRLDRPTE